LAVGKIAFLRKNRKPPAGEWRITKSNPPTRYLIFRSRRRTFPADRENDHFVPDMTIRMRPAPTSGTNSERLRSAAAGAHSRDANCCWSLAKGSRLTLPAANTMLGSISS